MINVNVHPRIRETSADCIHCRGSGQIAEDVDDERDWFEDEAHECWTCLGTSRTMSKAERKQRKVGKR